MRLEVAALSAVVAYAKQRKIIPANFIRQIERPAQAKRKRRVDGVEVAGLRSVALSDNARAAEAARFVLLLRYLGCRPGELAKLRRADVSAKALYETEVVANRILGNAKNYRN